MGASNSQSSDFSCATGLPSISRNTDYGGYNVSARVYKSDNCSVGATVTTGGSATLVGASAHISY